MTPEQFEKAAVLLEELNKLKGARDAIKSNISMRESQLEYTSKLSPIYDWLHKCAGRLILGDNKAKLAVRAETARHVEFEIDEGFIGSVLLYLDARIEEKSKELREL